MKIVIHNYRTRDASLSPEGNPVEIRANHYSREEQPGAYAFVEGSNAYMRNEAESTNPFQGSMGIEWRRGYRNTRGGDRAAATWRKKRGAGVRA